MNQRRIYKHLAQGEAITLANGAPYTADKPGVYVLFDNGSVIGPYANYEEAEQSASATVNSWQMIAR